MMDLPTIEKPWMYGTAWKEERTAECTKLALVNGFRAIDTANQRKHYDEAGVGKGIAEFMKLEPLGREALFIQTKFTFAAGQDHRLPYDSTAPIRHQVAQSFDSSLQHLGVDYIDSLVLHGPSQRNGLGNADWEAWVAMEELLESQKVRSLGISNVSIEQLEVLVQRARIKPQWVQNRCYAITGWDRQVRKFCLDHDLRYQGFSLLTANSKYLSAPLLLQIAKRYDCTIPAIVFRFAIDIGMVPLTGTTNVQHMREDLRSMEFQLSPEEVSAIEKIAV